MRVNEVELDFNLEHYLETKGTSFKLVGNNAMMCCPFHKEQTPSFGVNLKTGVFHCLSGSCGAKGNVANLIQKLEGFATYEEAQNWLIHRYGVGAYESSGPLELLINDNRKATVSYVPEAYLKALDFRHPYLEGRGITKLWQGRFRVGFCTKSSAITMPWFDRLGRCVGVKYRAVWDKRFWYYSPNEVGPNNLTLYGINHVYRKKLRKISIVESEIDALYCWQCGFPAVALGTSAMTAAQLNELKNTYVDEVIIATDNDEAGEKAAVSLMKKLYWIPSVRRVNWKSFSAKDVNDLSAEDLTKLIERPIILS